MAERGQSSFKCCILGNTGVGKSCLVARFGSNTFDSSNETTVGAAFKAVTMQMEDFDVKIEIWDTAVSCFRCRLSFAFSPCGRRPVTRSDDPPFLPSAKSSGPGEVSVLGAHVLPPGTGRHRRL